jgi:hypothetical protein
MLYVKGEEYVRGLHNRGGACHVIGGRLCNRGVAGHEIARKWGRSCKKGRGISCDRKAGEGHVM